MHRIAGDTYVFQQDSAPAHRARDTAAGDSRVQCTQPVAAKQPRLKPGRLPCLGSHAGTSLQDCNVWHSWPSSSASLRLGQAFPYCHKRSHWWVGYYYALASKQRDVIPSTRCNQPALIRAIKRYHNVTSAIQSHPHFIKENSHAFICLNISNILYTVTRIEELKSCTQNAICLSLHSYLLNICRKFEF